MGGVSSEICRASYKYKIKILIHCGILLDFLCELNNRHCDEYDLYGNSTVIFRVFAQTCSWRAIISGIFTNTLFRSDTPADVCIFVAYERINWGTFKVFFPRKLATVKWNGFEDVNLIQVGSSCGLLWTAKQPSGSHEELCSIVQNHFRGLFNE
jgi:hypothetical protein